VKLDKGDFLGRDALLALKGKPPARRLLSFVATSPDSAIAHGGELILRNGEPAGEVTSAAYGHTVGGIVALGYAATAGQRVDDQWLSARFEIDIAGERVPVRASLKAPYDPASARLKG
jgi:glycine cleavage system aminomethyltransferase T